jgi:hypothetical protein
VRINAAKAVHLFNVAIYNMGASCVDAETGTASLQLTIENSSLDRCGVNAGTAGLTMATTTASAIISADLHNVHISGNVNGINAQNGTRVVVRNSVLALNTTGVLQSNLGAGGGASLIITGSTVSFSNTGFQSAAGGFIAASGNTFVSIPVVIFNQNGGQIFTGGDNAGFNNSATGATTGAVPKV